MNGPAGAAPGPRSWRPRARLWGLFFAAVFLFMGVRVFLALQADFVPARHLDADRSGYWRRPDGTAELVLVLLHAPGPGSVRTEVRPAEPGKAPLTVRVYPTAEVSERAPPAGETVLRIPLPAVARVRVLDLRWDHPEEHPQGHEFDLVPEGGGA